MNYDDHKAKADQEYLDYLEKLNASKNPFYLEDGITINPNLIKSIEELEFYIIENRIELGGSLINFPSDFKVVVEDLTNSVDVECYRFYEEDKHMQINLVEVYGNSVFVAIEINDEIYKLLQKIQKYILLF